MGVCGATWPSWRATDAQSGRTHATQTIPCALALPMQSLHTLLSTEFMLFALLRNAHWAVQSPAFKDLHVLFEEMYRDTDGVVDELAERIRTLGGQASIVPSDLERTSAIRTPPGDMHRYNAREIVLNVAEATEATIVYMRGCAKRIDELGEDQGTIDYLGSTIRQQEKYVWMLRAHLGE